jgi:hypothetical protein
MYDLNQEPILYYIAESLEKFMNAHTTYRENIRECFLIKNRDIVYNGIENRTLDLEFFGNNLTNVEKTVIGMLTVEKIINKNGTSKSINEFSQTTGIRITEEKFSILRRACLESFQRNRKELSTEKISVDLTTFCNRFRKGSKNFRKILSGPLEEIISRNISVFADLTQTIIGLDKARKLNAFWGYGFLSAEMKTFMFKLHNNILGLNSRVAHFGENVDPTCTFCTVARDPEAENETTLHLFYSCAHTERTMNSFFRWAYNERADFFMSRSELFTIQDGEIIGDSASYRVKTLIAKMFMKYIWDCKVRYTIPTLNDAKEQLLNSVKTMYSISVSLRDDIQNSGLGNILLQG